MAMASELWAAPVISSPFSLLASSLPMQDVTLPIAEAALIHLAVSGALVDTATPVDRLLTFREKHKDLAGRLRGSLIDLASTIRTDLSTSAVVGQARAVLTNRVEPSLSALESELKKGRISFAWTNMFGVGGLVAGSASVTTPVSAESPS